MLFFGALIKRLRLGAVYTVVYQTEKSAWFQIVNYLTWTTWFINELPYFCLLNHWYSPLNVVVYAKPNHVTNLSTFYLLTAMEYLFLFL